MLTFITNQPMLISPDSRCGGSVPPTRPPSDMGRMRPPDPDPACLAWPWMLPVFLSPLRLTPGSLWSILCVCDDECADNWGQCWCVCQHSGLYQALYQQSAAALAPHLIVGSDKNLAVVNECNGYTLVKSEKITSTVTLLHLVQLDLFNNIMTCH